MTSYPKDSAGVDFDPDLHQTLKGKPRLNKAGRYIVQAQKALKRSRTKPGHEAPSSPGTKPEHVGHEAPEAASSPEAPKPEAQAASSVELAPELRSIAPATPEEILGTELPPVTKEPDGSPVAEDAPPASTEGTPPEATAPPPPPVFAEGSAVAPDDPAGEPDSELKREGMARIVVSVFETSTRMGIDAEEWELDNVEREDLTGSVVKVLDKWNINPDVGPEGELAIKLFAIGARRVPKPKTRAKLATLWARIRVKWFGAKPPEEIPPKKNPEPEPVE